MFLSTIFLQLKNFKAKFVSRYKKTTLFESGFYL